MLKKIVLGTLLIGLIGILVAGAVIRTIDKTGNVAEARGEGRGQGGDGVAYADEATQASYANGRGGGGQGRGAGTAASVESAPLAEAVAPEDWLTYEGTVTQAPAAGVDMVLAGDDGQELIVGTGPGYLEEQGFSLEAGERVQVQGFWEDGEFKAGQLTRLRDGATIMIRDLYGRPAWSGAFGRGTGGQGAGNSSAGSAGAGGAVSPESAPGGYGGEGNTETPGDGTGTGQAQVDEWLTLAGSVVSVDADELLVQTDDGQQILIDGRARRFLDELGFAAQIGQRLQLTGFYEDGDFEVGTVENLTTGQTVEIRDETGRPLWAGRGRRSGTW
ncbi:MAG: hypothetical protein PVJ34_07120 [Anaerolineae bacterium]|jgi:hypothetical protein